MSKDIRSFFQVKKQKPTVDQDEDIIPESPDVKIKNKKKESRKKRVIQDDSDEDTKSKKKNTNSLDKSYEKSGTSKIKLKEVNASDMFGNGPLKRTEPLIKKEKKQTESGIHSDEEFEKSLLEIDNIEEMHTKQMEIENADNKLSIKDNANLVGKIKKQSERKELSLVNDSLSKEPTNTVNKIENTKMTYSKRKFADFTESQVKHDNENVITKRVKCDNDETCTTMIKTEDIKDHSMVNDDEYSKINKKNHNKSLNKSILTDEERHERKIQSAALYKKYVNRSGPKHLGAKEIPEGLPDCLKDYAFLLTGVLDSFEREEIVDAINKYGGCIKNGVSKKVTHVLAGEDGGPAKIAKAQELGIPIINEDQFLDMIKNSQKKTKIKSESETEKLNSKSSNDKKVSKNKDMLNKSHESKNISKVKKIKSENDVTKNKSPKKDKHSDKDSGEKIKINGDHSSDNLNRLQSNSDNSSTSSLSINSNNNNDIKSREQLGESSMWVEKYKPQNVKQIIGQHGDASNAKKLINWLTKWYTNRKAKLPKPNPWAKNDDGGYYKAALLSGPPGVGKTTTVGLVCKELGFDIVEFNASDTRNKTLIKEQIGELLTTTSLSGYAKGDTSKQAVSKKHVLVMDEVDGMAGNEDRGGLQELINLIKITAVPIICMCNDRNSQKMRSLVNYCYDLRFSRPRVDQIKSAMMSICFKEGIKMPPDALSQLIVSANQDVRQTLNLLSMWSVDSNLTDSDRLKREANNFKKDVKLGPWEAIRKVFSAEDHKTMTINNKSDLFFYDYSLAPLFVQENYLQVAPHCPKHEVLQRVSNAADSICLGDIIEARIRRSQAWSLLPVQAMYSSVIPGHELSGHMTGQIQFPGWLGKNSRANKMHRLCQEIHSHTRLCTSGSKSSIFLDYCTHLRDAIVNPLIKDKNDGISESLGILESYHLLREDLDSLVELSLWPGQRNPTILIDSKVKAAMTRTYNKTASALPYAPGAARRARGAADEDMDVDEDNVPEQSEDSDPENDGLIKVQKKKSSETRKTDLSKDKPSTSKTKINKEKRKKK